MHRWVFLFSYVRDRISSFSRILKHRLECPWHPIFFINKYQFFSFDFIIRSHDMYYSFSSISYILLLLVLILVSFISFCIFILIIYFSSFASSLVFLINKKKLIPFPLPLVFFFFLLSFWVSIVQFVLAVIIWLFFLLI